MEKLNFRKIERAKLFAKWLVNWVKPICEMNNISLEEVTNWEKFNEIKKFFNFCEKNSKYNDNQLKNILEKMLKWLKFEDALIEFENSLIDNSQLEKICRNVLKENQIQVQEYHNWKLNLIWYFIWQVNKVLQNNWNPKEIKQVLEQILSQK